MHDTASSLFLCRFPDLLISMVTHDVNYGQNQNEKYGYIALLQFLSHQNSVIKGALDTNQAIAVFGVSSHHFILIHCDLHMKSR